MLLFLLSSIFHSQLKTQVRMRELKPKDYHLGSGPSYEFSLVGKDNKTEKLMVTQKKGLFSKNLKVTMSEAH